MLKVDNLQETRELDTTASREVKGGMTPMGFMSLINEMNIQASQNAIGVNIFTGPSSLVQIGTFAPTSLIIGSGQTILANGS